MVCHSERSSLQVLQQDHHLEAVLQPHPPAAASFYVGSSLDEGPSLGSPPEATPAGRIQASVEVHSPMGEAAAPDFREELEEVEDVEDVEEVEEEEDEEEEEKRGQEKKQRQGGLRQTAGQEESGGGAGGGAGGGGGGGGARTERTDEAESSISSTSNEQIRHVSSLWRTTRLQHHMVTSHGNITWQHHMVKSHGNTTLQHHRATSQGNITW